MSVAQDGFNIAATGTEYSRKMVGPATTFLDLGEGNGNLIRSGNATVVRVALWSHMRLNADGNSANLVFTESLANYPSFEGFAPTLTSQCSRHAASADASIGAGGVIGQAFPAGTYPNGMYGGSTWFDYPANKTFMSHTAEFLQFPTYAGMTVAAVAPVNNAGPGTNTVAIVEGASISIAFRLYEMIVVDNSTLVVRAGLSCVTGTPEAIKTDMLSRVRSGSRAAPPNLYHGVYGQIYAPDTSFVTATLTFANADAKAFLAQFPYFLVQYGDATNARYLVHACSFVA